MCVHDSEIKNEGTEVGGGGGIEQVILQYITSLDLIYFQCKNFPMTKGTNKYLFGFFITWKHCIIIDIPIVCFLQLKLGHNEDAK